MASSRSGRPGPSGRGCREHRRAAARAGAVPSAPRRRRARPAARSLAARPRSRSDRARRRRRRTGPGPQSPGPSRAGTGNTSRSTRSRTSPSGSSSGPGPSRAGPVRSLPAADELDPPGRSVQGEPLTSSIRSPSRQAARAPPRPASSTTRAVDPASGSMQPRPDQPGRARSIAAECSGTSRPQADRADHQQGGQARDPVHRLRTAATMMQRPSQVGRCGGPARRGDVPGRVVDGGCIRPAGGSPAGGVAVASGRVGAPARRRSVGRTRSRAMRTRSRARQCRAFPYCILRARRLGVTTAGPSHRSCLRLEMQLFPSGVAIRGLVDVSGVGLARSLATPAARSMRQSVRRSCVPAVGSSSLNRSRGGPLQWSEPVAPAAVDVVRRAASSPRPTSKGTARRMASPGDRITQLLDEFRHSRDVMIDRAEQGRHRPARGPRADPGRHLHPGPRPAGRRPGPGQDPDRQLDRPDPRRRLQADPVHARPDALGHHRHQRPGGARGRPPRLPVRPRPALLEHHPGRRDQPDPAQDPGGPAAGDAGARGHRRPGHDEAARALLRHRHPEPDRAGRDLPPARGPARPLHVRRPRRLPDARGGGEDPLGHDQGGAPRAEEGPLGQGDPEPPEARHLGADLRLRGQVRRPAGPRHPARPTRSPRPSSRSWSTGAPAPGPART